MKINSIAQYVTNTLTKHGYEAYIVGGYLRDAVMGRESEDVDIATSATPDEVERIFTHTAQTGIKHGTVLVINNDEYAEVTTFRTESTYSDRRHPDRVTFVKDVYSDLARRDFTVNAMAYNPEKGLVDPFSGQQDIKNKIIRAVGDPEKRFEEDALRILRCIRFAAVLGFDIEKNTAEAALALRENLIHVSRERVLSELNKTLVYAREQHIRFMLRLTDMIFTWKVTDRQIAELVRSKYIQSKWAWLCGDKTQETLKGLKSPAQLMYAAAELCGYEKKEIENPLTVFHKLKYVTPCQLADYKGDERILAEYCKAVEQKRPIYPSQLALGGREIMQLGFKGSNIGKIQKMLFEHILVYPEDNNKERLTGIIERREQFGNN